MEVQSLQHDQGEAVAVVVVAGRECPAVVAAWRQIVVETFRVVVVAFRVVVAAF